MLVVLVCGGRVGRNLTKRRIYAVLDGFAARNGAQGITIVHGGAAWVDSWAGEWAVERGHRVILVKIDGTKDGYKPDAPFNRNKRMFRETNPDVCLGFPGGGGTFDMMEICHDAGVPVGDVELNNDDTWEIKWWKQK